MQGQAPLRLSVPVSGRDHGIGPEDAPVTLVEYGDYECPYCGKAEYTMEEIQERGGNQVRWIYRHFPNRTIHPHAMLAAEAAEAAAAQGKFWEMHKLLFQNQDALEMPHLIEYADQLDLDVESFERDLQEHIHADRVREDFRSGMKSGVRGTPTWYINDVRYDGAWDPESLLEVIRKPMGVRIQLLTQEFTRMAASGGLMLLIFSLVALFWANSSLSHSYAELWESNLNINLGRFILSEHLLEWVNDGLMVIFFFVVGLEIKREITAGQLASAKRAALPIVAAIGGMLFPALIYLAFNAGDPGALPGWGIPMATDIAFTLGILTVLGGRIPLSLKVFFTALAITDDLGGILVIAVFYSENIVWINLAIAGAFFLALIVLNRWRVYSPLPYALLGIGLWLAFLQSGVHPTIAGVLLALTIPTRSPANVRRLIAQTDTVLNRYDYTQAEGENQEQALVRTLKTILDRMEPPAQRLEHNLQPWTTYLILPIFALANAGIDLQMASPISLIHPVSIGIVLGLVLGKPVGITLFSWIAVRAGWAEKPEEISWGQFVSATFLAGIGFTMSLFITQAAIKDPALLSTAKLGILIGSIIAAAVGWILLNLTSPRYESITAVQSVAASSD